MHKSLLLLVAIVLGSACAAPEYYTFTGSVASISVDKGGYAAAHQIKAGTAVSFVFEVDTARLAYTLDRGIKTEMHDTDNVSQQVQIDYFFDSLLTPSLFSPAVTANSGQFMGFHNASDAGTGTHYGAGFMTILGDAVTETALDLYLPNPGATEFLPKLNDLVPATEVYIDGNTAHSEVYLNLQCIAISSTKPAALTGSLRARAPRAVAQMKGGLLIDPADRMFLASGRRAGTGR